MRAKQCSNMKYLGTVTALAFLIAAVLACDGVSRIGGRVVDLEGRPVKDASVLFEVVRKGQPTGAYQCDTRTAADGSFGCGLTHAPFNIDLRLTISKHGYTTYTRDLKAEELKQSSG